MSNFDRDGIYFIPFGGADEIGINMYVYAVKGKLIVVDAGYGFLNDDYPGMDLAFADASLLENYAEDIEGLFVTHAHEDHFGAIAHIWPKLKCPVYATDFTLGLIRERLREYHLEQDVPLISVSQNTKVDLTNFSVEFIPIVHSVPETSALAIRTPFGNIVHATDWRLDDGGIAFLKTDYEALKQIAQEGVALFVCDSTNALLDEKQPTEKQVRDSLIQMIPTYKNGLIATCFASNLMRLESLILAAYEAQRTPVLVGRSLIQNMRIAKENGYFENLPKYLDISEAKDIPSDKALYICTGSQANYRSALTLIANGDYKDIKLSVGDSIIFSSKMIPGNEDKIERLQEKLRMQGVEVITSDEALVHTSGHATKEELQYMYNLLQPEAVLPVHGSRRFTREQQRFALSCGIKQVETTSNGDVMLYHNHCVEKIEEIATDILGVDRYQETLLSSQLVKNRRRIAYNCSVFISLCVTENWQIEDLQITSIDILEEPEFIKLAAELKDDVLQNFAEIVKKYNYRTDIIVDMVKAKIRKGIFKATGIKPVTFMHFYRLHPDDDYSSNDSGK
ncbi:MAG: ribonuclease J [Alphaproteobacteria bacterium]|nr:ribonuclease J [Alphaproteobacteria bacterium]